MGRYISDIKNSYLENLAVYHNIDRISEIVNQDLYSPIYRVVHVHEDEAPKTREHNTMLSEIVMDLNAINAELSEAAYLYYSVIDYYKRGFDSIKETLQKEYEIQSDLNILCNVYTEFDNVISIDPEELALDNTYVTNNSIIHLPVADSENIKLTVSVVSGNGYAGNGHVYDTAAEKFISETIDSSKQEYIVSEDNAQYFEYSRLVTNDITNTGICADVNNDSNAARCTVYLSAEKEFNILQINSDQKYLRIVDLYTSNDGLSYTVLSDFHNFDFNNTDNKYTINNYILNSGIINIPDSKYVKITFESFDYNSNEVLACDGKSIKGIVNPSVINETTILNNTQRYCVRINSIQAFKKEYEDTFSIVTANLIESANYDINAVALFANEYVPNVASANKNVQDYIKYFIIVNDKEYEIVPINRNVDYNIINEENCGTKIIRASNNLNNSKYTEYISDNIRSLKLKISLSEIDKNNSPYISNVKILRGESKDS